MGLFSLLFNRRDIYPVDAQSAEILDDSRDMIIEEPVDPDFKLAGMRLGLIYQDYSSNRSTRVVRLKRLEPLDGDAYIHAFCELRREDRTFLVSRIQSLFEPATGEVLAIPTDYFEPYIAAAEAIETEQFEKRNFKKAWHLIESLRHELQVLILVARSDGRFVKPERSILLRYARERATDLAVECDDEALVILENWMRSQDPSEPEARLALSALKDSKSSLTSIWEVAELMAMADGKIKESELATVQHIREEIEEILRQM